MTTYFFVRTAHAGTLGRLTWVEAVELLQALKYLMPSDFECVAATVKLPLVSVERHNEVP